MGLKLTRKKARNLKLSLAYKLTRLLPIGSKKKLKLLLDLAWIFNRLAHEQTFKTDIKIEQNPDDSFLITKIEESMSVLDVGCGPGYVIEHLLYKTNNITGVDYDKTAIERAKEKFKDSNITLLCDDVFNFLAANENKTFDVVVMSHLLEHIDNPGKFLQKMSTKANFFYIEVPDFETNHLNLYRKVVGTDLIYTDADHVSEFDRKELEHLIAQANLHILEKNFSFGVMQYWLKSN